jgi:hypothetical protein
MDQPVSVKAARSIAVLVTLGIGLVACTPASSQPAASNGGPGTSSAASSAAASSSGPVASGAITVEGSLVSSRIYDATWTWQPGNAADPGIGGITLNSDKGTFGNVQVLADGSITFTSGASELSGNAVYKGTGAQVRLVDQIPCGFTLDNDVTGSDDGRVLHLKGTLTIHAGLYNC